MKGTSSKSITTEGVNPQKLSKILKNSLKNINEPKPDRLSGKSLSLTEAKEILRGKIKEGRIAIRENDVGELLLEDGRHLTEAFSRLNKRIPFKVLSFTSDEVKEKFLKYYQK